MATPVGVVVRLPDCWPCELDEKVTHYCVVQGAAGQPAGVTRSFGTFANLVRDPSQPWWNGCSAIPLACPSRCGVFASRRDAEAHYRMELGLEASAVVPLFA